MLRQRKLMAKEKRPVEAVICLWSYRDAPNNSIQWDLEEAFAIDDNGSVLTPSQHASRGEVPWQDWMFKNPNSDRDPEPSGVVWYFCSADCRFGATLPFSPGHAHDYKDLSPSVVPGDAKCARCEAPISA
jgi:hypothetical protein